MLSRSYGRVLYMANPLTRQDVNRIAELAHLQLSNEEAELFTRQLGDILRYAERLQEVDTTAVEMKKRHLTLKRLNDYSILRKISPR